MNVLLPRGMHNFLKLREPGNTGSIIQTLVGLVCQRVHISHYLLLYLAEEHTCVQIAPDIKVTDCPSLPGTVLVIKPLVLPPSTPSVLGKLGWLVTLLNFLPQVVMCS